MAVVVCVAIHVVVFIVVGAALVYVVHVEVDINADVVVASIVSLVVVAIVDTAVVALVFDDVVTLIVLTASLKQMEEISQSIELFDSFSRWMLEADSELLFTLNSCTKKGFCDFWPKPT